MSRGITLAPCGLTIERVEVAAEQLVIMAKPSARLACCPACGAPSGRLHSCYRRSLSDLPSQGRQVTVVVSARRFRCADEECPQQIFAERLEATSTSAQRF
ncbi:MAG: transposase family protein [Rhodopila sp.]